MKRCFCALGLLVLGSVSVAAQAPEVKFIADTLVVQADGTYEADPDLATMTFQIFSQEQGHQARVRRGDAIDAARRRSRRNEWAQEGGCHYRSADRCAGVRRRPQEAGALVLRAGKRGVA